MENHRIIDDRIEKSIKGRRIGHCAFPASIFKVQRLRQYYSKLGGLINLSDIYIIPLKIKSTKCKPPPPLCVNLPSAKTFFIAAIQL